MNADEALIEMRNRSQYARRQRRILWADAIEAELKALQEKVAMLEKPRHDHRWSYSEPVHCLDCGEAVKS